MFFETLRRIKSIATRHSGKTYTPEGITHLIRCQFQDSKLRFYTNRSSAVKRGEWWINGSYDIVDDQEDQPCIHIHLTFPSRQKKLHINNMDWSHWAFHVADVVTHEYLHRYYVHRRGMRFGRGYQTQYMGEYERNMKDYLGCEDEILAYGFSCAAEMLVFDKPFEKTRVYQLYRRHFRQDQKVVLQLKRQAIKYINNLERCNEQISPRSRNNHRRCV